MPAFKSIEFASPSLSHPRAGVRVDVLEKDPNRAPRVCWYAGDELFYSTDALHCYGELGYRVARTAIYSKPGLHGPLALASTEHLAPVFLMWPNQRFDVHVAPGDADGVLAELPMMDGSALPFFHAADILHRCGSAYQYQYSNCRRSLRFTDPRGSRRKAR